VPQQNQDIGAYPAPQTMSQEDLAAEAEGGDGQTRRTHGDRRRRRGQEGSRRPTETGTTKQGPHIPLFSLSLSMIVHCSPP